MRPQSKFILFLLAAAGAFLIVRHANHAMHAAIPADMPLDSNFVQSGYDLQHNDARGQWIACRADPQQGNDWCRVTDAHGVVVYQGSFSPAQSEAAVPDGQLQISASPSRLWIDGPAEAGPIPVIPLRNGQILVPTQDRQALLDRWSANPAEFHEIQGL